MRIQNNNQTHKNNRPSFQHILITPKTGKMKDCATVLPSWKKELDYLTNFIKEFDAKAFEKTNDNTSCMRKYISKNNDTIEYNERSSERKSKYKLNAMPEIKINNYKEGKIESVVSINTIKMCKEVRDAFGELLEKINNIK